MCKNANIMIRLLPHLPSSSPLLVAEASLNKLHFALQKRQFSTWNPTRCRVFSPKLKFTPKKKGYWWLFIIYVLYIPQIFHTIPKDIPTTSHSNDHRKSPRPLKRRPRQSLLCRRPRRKQTKAGPTATTAGGLNFHGSMSYGCFQEGTICYGDVSSTISR